MRKISITIVYICLCFCFFITQINRNGLLPKVSDVSCFKFAAFFVRFYRELYQQDVPPSSLPGPTTTSVDIEHQQVWLPSPPSPSPLNDHELRQPRFPSQLEPLPAVPNLQQWQNSVIAFCFSYALGVSLQYAGPDQSNHHQLPLPLVLLSYLVLLTFIFILVVLFIHPKSTVISQALQKVALLLAAAALCQTLSIPFSFELKCAIWALFFLSLLLAMIITYLNTIKA
ncbi:Detected protein of unknown function [Hibiscus syriacus]|uniref:Uncharacterized protein n=1 Tax=Hibiscus syriacus TaxID=106335 RepID=A0A6A2ZMS8_HIBSY|nr:Detected protein of unknown function [Hibiscus syriacus]